MPIFLMAERGDTENLNAEVMRSRDEFIWMLEDTTFFIAGRIMAAMRRYREAIAPPMTKALMRVRPGLRVFMAHARAHGRDRFSKVAGGASVLRLFRRKPAAL